MTVAIPKVVLNWWGQTKISSGDSIFFYMLIGLFRRIGLLAKVWCSHHREFCEKKYVTGSFTLKRLSTLIVFLMVVSSLVFLMRARHLTESTIPFYLVNCQTGESPNMLFEFFLTGMKISRCVYAGEGIVLLFSVLLMGFVKAAFCHLTCLIYIYVDDLSVALNACRVGCYVGKVIINHLMYADDLVILAPSVAGLSKLLSICEMFGQSNDVIFNQKKSASLYFISKMLKELISPMFILMVF